MIGKDEIAKVCRDNDTEIETDPDMSAFFAQRNVEWTGLMYVATQRALRVIMLDQGYDPRVTPTTSLSRLERRRLESYAALFVDGFAVGLGQTVANS